MNPKPPFDPARRVVDLMFDGLKGKRHVREQEAADKLCLGMAKSQGLLQSLATLMADGAPEGFKASAYAAMALREVRKRFPLGPHVSRLSSNFLCHLSTSTRGSPASIPLPTTILPLSSSLLSHSSK